MTCRFVLSAYASVAPSSAMAAAQTIVLTLPGMQCHACPVAVQRALMRVNGVSKAQASLPRREVVVTHEDSRTGIAGLTAATAAIGYPSAVRK